MTMEERAVGPTKVQVPVIKLETKDGKPLPPPKGLPATPPSQPTPPLPPAPELTTPPAPEAKPAEPTKPVPPLVPSGSPLK